MRILISFLIGIVMAVVAVGLGVLVAENGQSEHIIFLGTSFWGNKGWLTVGAVALGFLLAVLLLIPGRLSSAWQRGALGRQARARDDRLRELREQHAELQGSHRRLLEEHQRVMQQVLTPVMAGREQAASVVYAGAATQPRPQSVGSE
ncbi:MAG: hypothetical protein ACLQUY_09880 [Ktedonobacterales bacterium]